MILVDALINTLYPRHCIACETHLDARNEALCSTCFKELKLIDPTYACPKCMHPSEGLCPRCRHRPPRFNQMIITLQEDILSQKLLHSLDKKMRKTIVALMLIQLERISILEYDGVSYLGDYHLAKEVAKALQLPLKKRAKRLLIVCPTIKEEALERMIDQKSQVDILALLGTAG